MKDEDVISNNEPSPTIFDHERDEDSDRSVLSPAYQVSQEAPAPTHPLKTERWLTPRCHPRLLLVMLAVALVALGGGYSVFRSATSPARQASSAFQQAPCPFPLGTGLVVGQNIKCGFLVVPEDRSLPKGPTIRLAVAIFKTPSSQPDIDPVLFLNGGPGNALLETKGPTFNAGNLASRMQNRDLILLDQRGTGFSQPSLRCLDDETLRACHERLVKSGLNLNAYTTLADAADVHDLIGALGYQQVNLEGVSYGTRLALTVMRLFPADLRSAILDSALPPQANLITGIPPAAIRAFDVFFQGCAADHSCNASCISSMFEPFFT
jgi:pimeloyl-ACP methyl ester carboxylesterase